MNALFKAIIIKGLKIRKDAGEDVEAVVATYTNLTETERKEILKMLENRN